MLVQPLGFTRHHLDTQVRSSERRAVTWVRLPRCSSRKEFPWLLAFRRRCRRLPQRGAGPSCPGHSCHVHPGVQLSHQSRSASASSSPTSCPVVPGANGPLRSGRSPLSPTASGPGRLLCFDRMIHSTTSNHLSNGTNSRTCDSAPYCPILPGTADSAAHGDQLDAGRFHRRDCLNVAP
jgi:hypothetical protein